MKSKLILLIIIAFVISGCTGIEVRKVTSKNEDSVKGIRYYRPWPYLLVTQNTEDISSLKLEIIYLPNTKESYAINMKSGVGTSDYSLALKDGWLLTEFNEKRDTQVPEFIDSVGGIFSLADLTQLFRIDRNAQVKTIVPGLYSFKFDKDGCIKGFDCVVPFINTNE